MSIICPECEKIVTPELLYPRHRISGRELLDEDPAEFCPECHYRLTGDEVEYNEENEE
jgi:DNA-directed RNA polymerase subunit RPC12/RpoP